MHFSGGRLKPGEYKHHYQNHQTSWGSGDGGTSSAVAGWKHLLHFIVGFCVGVVIYELYHVQQISFRSSVRPSPSSSLTSILFGSKHSFVLENAKYFNVTNSRRSFHSSSEGDKNVTANRTRHSNRLLCLVHLKPDSRKMTLDAINSTWGSQCDRLLFLSDGNTSEDAKNVVHLSEQESRWDWKPCSSQHCPNSAWNYVYSTLKDKQFDWVVVPNSGTFVVIPNLKFVLGHYNASLPFYFGNSKQVDSNLQLISEPVQILSRAAVRELTRYQLNNSCDTSNTSGSNWNSFNLFKETSSFSEIMTCVKKSKMNVIRPLDSLNRPYFLSNSLQSAITGTGIVNDGFKSKNSLNTTRHVKGFQCCSDLLIAFKVTSRAELYADHLIINQIHPYGISPPHYLLN